MSLENAKVLHKHFLEIGRTDWAAQQEKNYPELAGKQKKEKPVPKPEPEQEAPPEKPEEEPKKKSLLTKAKEALKK